MSFEHNVLGYCLLKMGPHGQLICRLLAPECNDFEECHVTGMTS